MNEDRESSEEHSSGYKSRKALNFDAVKFQIVNGMLGVLCRF